MVQGSWDRREIVTRRVEYVIETPYGQPIEAKTLGVVLAQVHQELGDRIQYDDAYHVRGEDGQVIISFEVETETKEPEAGFVIENDPMRVLVVEEKGGNPVYALRGRMRLQHDTYVVEVLSTEAATATSVVTCQATVLIRNPREGGSDYQIIGTTTGISEHGLTVEIPAEWVGRAARSLGLSAEVPT